MIGEVTAKPGETKTGYAYWVELRDGTRVGLPVIAINGVEDGPRVVICASTHPTELVAIGGLQIVRKKLNPKKMKGSVVLFPISNPLAYQHGSYVSPQDGVNLFSAYPGSPDGSPTYRIANFIYEKACRGADVVMDFHENQVPCLSFTLVARSKPDVERKVMNAANAFGITIIRGGEAKFTLPGTRASDLSFTELCAQNGIAAFSPEFEGGPESWFYSKGSPAVESCVRGVLNVLKYLKMIDGKIEPQTGIKVLKGNFEARGIVHAERAGLVDRLADTSVKITKGTVIARILNPFGDELEVIRMPWDGYLWGWTCAGGSNLRHITTASGGNVAYVFVEK